MAIKIRIIPTLLFKEMGLVKGITFDSWRRVGTAMQAIKVYNLRDVDELVFLDIMATDEGRRPDFDMVDELADECFFPFAVGGGITCVEDVQRLLRVGADKVVLNTAAVERPELISEIAQRFGSQCVIVSIDARRNDDDTYETFIRSGKQSTGQDPVIVAQRSAELGAGEILITSIDRDGTMMGYDIELSRRVSEAISIPVIASGGAGSYEHMAQVLLKGKTSAVAAASIFHFTQQTPLEAKHYLATQGFRVRL
jgi:cyclase